MPKLKGHYHYIEKIDELKIQLGIRCPLALIRKRTCSKCETKMYPVITMNIFDHSLHRNFICYRCGDLKD